MRILFDTNILIDAAVQSRDYHDAANRLLVHAEQGALDGRTTPTAITRAGTCRRQRTASTLVRSSSTCRRSLTLHAWDGRP